MKKAVFTLQHNEYFYMPIWVKWYGETFAPEDMYIISHNTSPEMKKMLKRAEKDGINVEYVTTDVIFDHIWLNYTVQKRQRELLEEYDYVVYVDADELIEPDNTTLGNFIDNATEKAYRCEGWELLNDGRMFRSPGFDKTLISSIPLIYAHGYHTATPVFDITPKLKLYHIHRLDYEKALERNKRLAQEKWDAMAIDNALGVQNKIDDEQEFKNCFYDSVSPNCVFADIPQKILKRIYE